MLDRGGRHQIGGGGGAGGVPKPVRITVKYTGRSTCKLYYTGSCTRHAADDPWMDSWPRSALCTLWNASAQHTRPGRS